MRTRVCVAREVEPRRQSKGTDMNEPFVGSLFFTGRRKESDMRARVVSGGFHQKASSSLSLARDQSGGGIFKARKRGGVNKSISHSFLLTRKGEPSFPRPLQKGAKKVCRVVAVVVDLPKNIPALSLSLSHTHTHAHTLSLTHTHTHTRVCVLCMQHQKCT